MSYTLKYRYTFKTLQDDDCRVDIFIKDAPAGMTILNAGVPPFVLREFNTDQDFWKPLRPMMAELSILSDLVDMEDFLHPEDDGVEVQFYFNGTRYWVGWVIQDDIQETWIDTVHYIILRATDGLGGIGSQNLEGSGQIPMITYIGDALDNTPLKGQPASRTLVCNLFYEGMQDRDDGEFSALYQTTTDIKTFQGDNKLQALEKILRAWGMTVFQYRSRWWIIRLEEWLNNLPIRGLEQDFLADLPFTGDFKVNIGTGIVPIMPEMIRGYRRPFKKTKISFFYRFPDEIICNQSFLSGTLIPPTTTRYTIDCWTLYAGLPGSSTLPLGLATAYRTELTGIDGNITDNYITIDVPAVQGTHVLVSNPVYMNDGDSIEIGFEVRYPGQGVGPDNKLPVAVSVEAAGGIVYYLDSDGNWVQSTGFAGLRVYINVPYTNLERLDEFRSVNVRSERLPAPGILKIWFEGRGAALTTVTTDFRDLQFTIREASKVPGVIGDFDQYEILSNITQNFEEETFLDDSNNRAHKGALFFNDDLTGDRWYRMDYPGERLTFKRHKAIGHAYLNERYRMKLEVTMYGLKSAGALIGLHNRFILSDAPGKQFMIVNLQEMNFMDATWKANLLEVFDDSDTAEIEGHTFGNIYQRDV